MQPLSEKEKKALIKKCTPKSRVVKNTAVAFVVGGGICLFAEILRRLYIYLGASDDEGSLLATLSIVLVGGVLTAFGLFDRFARHAGAGTLVPITGFSNSVVSSALQVLLRFLQYGGYEARYKIHFRHSAVVEHISRSHL